MQDIKNLTDYKPPTGPGHFSPGPWCTKHGSITEIRMQGFTENHRFVENLLKYGQGQGEDSNRSEPDEACRVRQQLILT